MNLTNLIMSHLRFPCNGIILFNKQHEVLLVKTPQGHYGFPKGKKEKKETEFQTAVRELKEETGINAYDQLTFIRNNDDLVFLDELSDKGFPSVRYFIAITNEVINKFTFDTQELSEVNWYSVSEGNLRDGLEKSEYSVSEEDFCNNAERCKYPINTVLELPDTQFLGRRKELLQNAIKIINNIP